MPRRFIVSMLLVAVAQTHGGDRLPEVWQQAAPQARLAALRVAEIDARRRLAERIFGLQIAGSSEVVDMALTKDLLTSKAEAVLLGAARMDAPVYHADGRVTVVYGVRTDENHGRKCLVEAEGNGALPGTPGRAMVLARRAAELDAARKMSERLTGMKLSSKTTVNELLVKHDVIRSGVSTWIRGLEPAGVIYREDGSCEITVKLRTKEVPAVFRRLLKIAEVDAATAAELLNANLPLVEQTYSVTGYGAAPTIKK